MRSFSIRPVLRAFIGLAFVSSNALAIYALGVLFNRHLKAIAAGSSGGGGTWSKQESMTLELLWAPILLIHLGGKEEMARHGVAEENKQWIGETVTFASKVAVAMYVLYKSLPRSSDRRLLVATILLFVIGIASFSEKPWAHEKAKNDRLEAISAMFRGTKKRRMERIGGSGSRRQVLSDEDKILMVLSDISLLAAAEELVARKRARDVSDVLPPMVIPERTITYKLVAAFELIYTRASLVASPLYLLYHMAVVPVLQVAALALFAMSDKHPYELADVKVTYVLLCLTATLDVVAVFSHRLVYQLMFMTGVPALCETLPGYSIIDAALPGSYKGNRFIYKCAGYFVSVPEGLRKKVASTLLLEVIQSQGRDLASCRIFKDHSADQNRNWILSSTLQELCGEEIKKSLGGISFDRSVLLWHIATDLCFRCIDEQDEGGGGVDEEVLEQGDDLEARAAGRWIRRLILLCTCAISKYMAHLLKFNPEMLLTGSKELLISEAIDEIKSCFLSEKEKLMQREQLKKLISDIANGTVKKADHFFHIVEACKVAKELLDISDESLRWELMYKAWLGMMCYSAGMGRGYLHAKSLGEGGEFLSFVWLGLSLMGAQTLAHKLQMPPETR